LFKNYLYFIHSPYSFFFNVKRVISAILFNFSKRLFVLFSSYHSSLKAA